MFYHHQLLANYLVKLFLGINGFIFVNKFHLFNKLVSTSVVIICSEEECRRGNNIVLQICTSSGLCFSSLACQHCHPNRTTQSLE